MKSLRIQIPAEILTALCSGSAITLSQFPRQTRALIMAHTGALDPILEKDAALPVNPTIEDWSAMTISQRETYSDEIFFDMESRMI